MEIGWWRLCGHCLLILSDDEGLDVGCVVVVTSETMLEAELIGKAKVVEV